jgi:hypothetical protein
MRTTDRKGEVKEGRPVGGYSGKAKAPCKYSKDCLMCTVPIEKCKG